jgi:hypothetical protein
MDTKNKGLSSNKVSVSRVLLALSLLLALFIIALVVLRQWRLYELTGSFASMKHPNGTAALSFRSSSCTLHSNIDVHFIGEVRTYEGTKAEIESFYKPISLPDPWDSNRVKPVEVAFMENGSFPRILAYRNFSQASAWSLTPVMTKRKLYIVYFVASGV